MRRTLVSAWPHGLGCWSKDVARSHRGSGAFKSRVLRSWIENQSLHASHTSCHQPPLANCDWMIASNTSGQYSYHRRHPTCWASWQGRHTVSSTPCHGAGTPAPLWHPFVTTTQQPFSYLTTAKLRCYGRITDGVRNIWTLLPHSVLSSPRPAPTILELPIQEEYGSGLTASSSMSHAPLLLSQMGSGILCGLCVWRRGTNRRPCRPRMSNPSTSPWTAWPDGSG